MSFVSLLNVNKRYSLNNYCYHVLKDISLNIKHGDFLSIVGPSGSGKSTLLKIIGLLESCSSGSIKINDLEYSNISEGMKTSLRRSLLGFIFQDYNLLPDFTALENVLLPQSILGISKEKALTRAQKVFDDLQITNKHDYYPEQLSGGEQQRVSIARSLINRPELILADEPTGNLDSKNTKIVVDILKRISTKYNTAIVIVTHNTDIAKSTDITYYLNNGILSPKK